MSSQDGRSEVPLCNFVVSMVFFFTGLGSFLDLLIPSSLLSLKILGMSIG